MNPTTARLKTGVAEADRLAPPRSRTREDNLESFPGLAATTKIRRGVATIHASEARTVSPSALFAAVSLAIAALDVTEIEAIVLRGRRIFETDGMAGLRNDPDVQAAVRAVTRCPAPVVAMIEGSATGPGLELALACAARLARDGATFAFPGVGFGRLPMYGAARNLPRLIGYPEAARMLVFREAVSAREALRLGLIDGLDVDDVERFAVARRSKSAGAVRRHPTGSEKTAAEVVLLGIGQRLKRERPGEATPLAALRVIEAAIGVSEAEAMAEAARLDDKLSHTEEAAALLHATAGSHALVPLGADGEARLADLAACAFWPLFREAVHLLDEGASPAQVDRCLTAYGFVAGPFARSDECGAAALFESGAMSEAPSWHSYSPTVDFMADAGRPGGPGKAGWYRPSCADGAAPRSDPAVDRVLESSAVSQRLRRRPIADEVIARRCLYAAMNGTAALAEAAPDLDAKALDAIWTTRLGFPRWKGGPLFQGALVGHAAVVAELEASRRTRDTAGAPSLLLGRLLAELA